VLEASEIQSLLSHLEAPHRLMVLLAVTTGLRRSELFALKWRDFDFPTRTLQIRRSIYNQTVGKCKSPTQERIYLYRLALLPNSWSGSNKARTRYVTRYRPAVRIRPRLSPTSFLFKNLALNRFVNLGRGDRDPCTRLEKASHNRPIRRF